MIPFYAKIVLYFFKYAPVLYNILLIFEDVSHFYDIDLRNKTLVFLLKPFFIKTF